MDPTFAIACWERAATEELGIILTLDDERDKRVIEQTLYKARQMSQNPSLDCLMIVQPGDNVKEIWLVKKTTDMSDIK